jgi:hypothetical protein
LIPQSIFDSYLRATKERIRGQERDRRQKYVVTLSDEERDQLNAMISKGKQPARQQLKARVLLKADASDAGEGWSDSQIATALQTSVDTVARTRQRLVEQGQDGALKRDHSPNSARQCIFDGEAEAKLIALTRCPPPKGRARWTLVLLEDQVVERGIVAPACDNTIGRTLKKVLKPHLNQQSVIPPEANAAFVANMEDVLEVYQRPRDPDCPVVCLDETSKHLIAETRTPIKAKPGRPARYDYEYRRNGTANLFMLFAPLEGWRHVEVTERHTAVDYARLLKHLADSLFPDAREIVLVPRVFQNAG